MRLLLSLLLFIGSITLSAQELFTKEQRLKDLKIFKDTLTLKHKDFFNSLSVHEFNEDLDSLKKREKLSVDEFYIELLKILAKVGDEHTRAMIKPSYKFPLVFYWFEEGLCILKADTTYKDCIFSKVKLIDGIPAEDILAKLNTLIKQDNKNYIKVVSCMYLVQPQILKALGITKRVDQAEFELENSKGKFKRLIKAIKAEQKPVTNPLPQENKLLRYAQNKAYWQTYIDSCWSFYFAYNMCNNMEDEPIDIFCDSLIKDIKQKNPAKLIIDLRNNSGGNSGLLNPFIDSLAEYISTSPLKIYVLIGRNTFSSAIMNAIDLKLKVNAILVGESTSGNINHFGEVQTVELPESKIRILYSTQYWENWAGHDGALKPDVEIPNTFKDFMDFRDKALESCLKKD